MDEIFKTIPEFPNYAVSNHGRFINKRKNQEMAYGPLMNGEVSVGLSKDGVQHRRSAKILVARAFVPGETEVFDTVIHLDGVRTNLMAMNLAWRPRWFAIKYHQQWENIPDWAWTGPVIDIVHEIEFPDIIAAAQGTGSLMAEIRISMMDDTKKVFPYGSVFKYSFR